MYLLMLDLAARSFAGPDAAMTSYERAMIEPPLGRILARHSAVSDRLASLADPLALVIGVAMWGGRVFDLAQRRRLAGLPASDATGASHAGATGAVETPAPPPPLVAPAPQQPEIMFSPAPVRAAGEAAEEAAA